MARGRLFREPVNTNETRRAEKLARLLTEDFGADLERIGYYLVRNHPMIVYRRFEVLNLAAQEEYDKLVGEMKGTK
jgi:hypothetical protein